MVSRRGHDVRSHIACKSTDDAERDDDAEATIDLSPMHSFESIVITNPSFRNAVVAMLQSFSNECHKKEVSRYRRNIAVAPPSS